MIPRSGSCGDVGALKSRGKNVDVRDVGLGARGEVEVVSDLNGVRLLNMAQRCAVVVVMGGTFNCVY